MTAPGSDTPPADWEFEVPRWRATRDLKPASKTRYRFEPPLSGVWDADEYQYSDRPIAAREEIETREWPHPSFHPLNYSAVRVLDFFNTRMKSRLTAHHGGAIRSTSTTV